MSQVGKNTWGPDFGGADVMVAQWLYFSLLDFSILDYILFNNF